MKLVNKTGYNGRDLRGLLLACARFFDTPIGDGTVEHCNQRSGQPFASGQRFVSARADTVHRINYVFLMQPALDVVERMDVVGKLAAVNDGVAALPASEFLQLCSVVEWVVIGSHECHTATPSWAEGRSVRFKVPPPKARDQDARKEDQVSRQAAR